MHKGDAQFRFHLGRWSVVVGRFAGYSLVGLVIVAVVAFFGLRAGLPHLLQNKGDIEQLISERAGLDISTERINIVWDGFIPGVDLYDLRVATTSGDTIVGAKRVRAILSLTSLLSARLGLASLTIYETNLDFRRDKGGRWWVGGLEFRTGNTGEARETTIEEVAAKPDINDIVSRLGVLEFKRSRISWLDQYRDQKPFVVSRAKLRLESNGTRHQLSFGGIFPDNFCGTCSFSADVAGKLDEPITWHGRLYTEASGFQPANLPLVFRSLLPGEIAGRFDLVFRAEVSAGKPRVFQGRLFGQNIKADVGRSARLDINAIDTDIVWRRAGEAWVLEARRLTLGIAGKPWNADHLWVARRQNETIARVGFVNIADLAVLAQSLGLANLETISLDQLKPVGNIHDLEFHLPDSLDNRSVFSVSAGFHNLGWLSSGSLPGISGIDGAVRADATSVQLNLKTIDGSINLPDVFRQPIELDNLEGRVKWTKLENNWQIEFNGIDVANRDMNVHGGGLFRTPTEKENSPYLETRWKFDSGNGKRAGRYFPVNLLKPALLSWLDGAIKDGRVVGGHAVYQGYLNDFPFRDNNGRFEVFVDIRDGVLKYLDGWPAVEKLDTRLFFSGSSMTVTANDGLINDMNISQVSVTARDFKDDQGRRLFIDGRVNAGGRELAALIRQVSNAPIAGGWAKAFPDVSLAGNSVIRLSLDFDPSEGSDFHLYGEYRPDFVFARLNAIGLEASAINGIAHFDQGGVVDGRFSLSALGGESRLTLSNNSSASGDRLVLLQGSGTLTANGVADSYASVIRPYLQGTGSWQGDITIDKAGPRLDLQAELDAMSSSMPVPLAKPAGTKTGLTIKSDVLNESEHLIRSSLSGTASTVTRLTRRGDRWRHDRTQVFVGGDAQLPAAPGIHVKLRSEELDLDAWRKQVSDMTAGRAPAPALFDSMSLVTDDVGLFDRKLGQMTINIKPHLTGWRALIAGTAAQGRLDYFGSREPAELNASFDFLSIPDKTYRDPDGPVDPRNLPRTRISSRVFRYGDRNFGEAELKAVPISNGWRVDHVRFWDEFLDATAWAELKRMGAQGFGELSLVASSKDFGETLGRLGMPGQVKSGKAHLNAELAWMDADEYSFNNATGKFDIKVESGSLIKLEQGAGKMLGVFDLGAFSRYARLDFSTIFESGYVFDLVKGTFDVERGHLYTRDFRMQGPSADMVASGRVGVATEDYDFVVGVNPSFSDTLAFASWGLGVPQVGAAILLFNRLFKKDIASKSKITYMVQGTWDKPQIRQLSDSSRDEKQGD
ncbi:MAG: YhdP family protein [Gammaproteobacteria bacterium]|nr:YhdP family protein [Gammaproteobacteria bacterium]